MIYVLDTCALIWAYRERSKFCRRCRYIISHCQGRVYVAEITVLEIVSALGRTHRRGTITLGEYSQANRRFLRDVASGALVVMSLPSSEFVACRDLLQLVGIDAGRNLQTQDAMVAYTARRLALERGEVVRLLTSDRRLAAIVKELPIFKNLVISEYLNPN